MTTTEPDLADKAERLFTYLSKVAALQHKPVREVDYYRRDGSLHWLADLPAHEAVRINHGDAADEDLIFSVERLPSSAMPPLPGDLHGWVDGATGQTQKPPVLRQQHFSRDTPRTQELADAFHEWIAKWETWRDDELQNKPVREIYTELYSSHVAIEGNPEEYEFVLGLGLVDWPENDHFVGCRRHAFTCPVTTDVDTRTGRIEVRRSESAVGLTVELDFVDPAAIAMQHVEDLVAAEAGSHTAAPLDEAGFSHLAHALVNRLAADGSYLADGRPSADHERLTVFWAPALIRRKRTPANLAQAFRRIATQIRDSQHVPSGLMPLVDPGRAASVAPETTPGAFVLIGEEAVAPLPLNDKQRTIVQSVNENPQTLVQGPPGTGKTHTAAALLSHLLAQGKRVLVTAQTERALAEVRGKLPETIKPLAVSVLGASRTEMSELRLSVETISRNAADHQPRAAEQRIDSLLTRMHSLGEERARLEATVLELRRGETSTRELGPYRGTPGVLARKVTGEASAHAWVLPYLGRGDKAFPLTRPETAEWWQLVREGVVLPTPQDGGLVSLADVPTWPEASALFDHVADEQETKSHAYVLGLDPAYPAVSSLTSRVRADLSDELRSLRRLMTSSASPAPWEEACRRDVTRGTDAVWIGLGNQIVDLATQAQQWAGQLPTGVRVDVMMPPAEALAQATFVRANWPSSPLKVDASGLPHFGLLGSRSLKKAMPFFEGIRVDGLPPTTPGAVDAVIAHVQAQRVLDAMDNCWAAWGLTTTGLPLRTRLDQHHGWYEQLAGLLQVRTVIGQCAASLARHGIPAPTWEVMHVDALITFLDEVETHERAMQAEQPWRSTLARLEKLLRESPSGSGNRVLDAFRRHDAADYRTAREELETDHAAARRRARRGELEARLGAAAPRLVADAAASPSVEWDARIGHLFDAWAWGRADHALRSSAAADANSAQDQISAIDRELNSLAAEVAAARAWAHATGPERLDAQARADLTQYVQLVQRLGKGTGKYAARQRGEIRRAMDNCRDSVPVWIMPLYKVVEQFDIRENIFDVVIVDEASQAGVSAVFLQYLAPRIVVIGDDKQVSPLAVGTDQDQLRRLAAEYLHDDRYVSSWQDPRRSLFDEAKMRYGSPITLVEHRRCMPEIIGFSNEIAYRPDGNALLPVRQYGAERLDPIRIIQTVDGVAKGETRKTNEAEARAIVDQIKVCCEDPAYEGRTMGVISLVGSEQAKRIEQLLLEEVPPAVWEERDLRCGDATAFQGSERDVIFLSMVSSVSPGQRIVAMTRTDALQRFNVAASRAKDQLWVVHSVSQEQLRNPEDLRRRLLDYCYSQVSEQAQVDWSVPELVREDIRVAPFGSVFQQKVHNALVARGFLVRTGVEAAGAVLDLVVVGRRGQLAVQCEGDAWQGADDYQRQLERQRDLVRCGWTLFRVKEAAFELDGDAALEPLLRLLAQHDIRPVDGDEPPETVDRVIVIRDPKAAQHDADSVEEAEEEQESPDFDLEAATLTIPPSGEDDEPAPVVAEPAAAPAPVPVTEPDSAPVPAPEPVVVTPPTTPTHIPAAPAPLQASPADQVASYRVFKGLLGRASELETYEVAEGLLRIVQTEGPVRGSRLFLAYVRSSGGGPVDRSTKLLLSQAVSHAVRQGLLISENPDGKQDILGRTYRLANQPEAVVRRLGPRDISEVPVEELAALLVLVQRDGLTTDEWFLRAVQALGQHQVTPRMEEHLQEGMAHLRLQG